MYCPNCNQYVDDGKFCPECGTKLVEEPEAKINLNLGRSNAIKGDINLSDSHNVHNEDKSVHNITNTTSTINNITQKIQFMEKCKEVFADGILAGQENAALEIERIRLGLDPVIAKQLIEVARRSSSFRMDVLTPRDSMTLKLLTNVLRSNDVDNIKHQLPRLEALAKAYAVDEVQYKYYLVLAALFPEKLVEKYEANTSDEYWKTFWVNIAYLKLGNVAKAESAAMRLPLYKQYSDENGMLLAIISVLNEFGPEPAADYLGAIMGTYSQELRLLHHALALLIDPDKAKELDVNKKACAFYLEYITTLESPEARAERLAKEKAEAEAARKIEEERKKAEEKARLEKLAKEKAEAEAAAAREREKAAAHITYTLTLTDITDELKATMSARVFLGWATALSRENFAKLPMVVKTTDNLDEAKTLYKRLSEGGMRIQYNAVNGLNEEVDVKLGSNSSPYSELPMDKIRAAAKAKYSKFGARKEIAVAALKIAETIQERDPNAEDPDFPTLDEAEVAYMVHPSEFDSTVDKHARPINFLFMKDGVPKVAVLIVTKGSVESPNTKETEKACTKNNFGHMRVYATGDYADWIEGEYSEITGDRVTDETVKFCKDWLVNKINAYLRNVEKAEAETLAARAKARKRLWGRFR